MIGGILNGMPSFLLEIVVATVKTDRICASRQPICHLPALGHADSLSASKRHRSGARVHGSRLIVGECVPIFHTVSRELDRPVSVFRNQSDIGDFSDCDA